MNSLPMSDYKASFRNINLVAALCAILAACVNNTAPEKAAHWYVEYKVSGGFAGKIQGLDIGHDGHYRVYDRKRRLVRKRLATPEQLATLSEQIALLAAKPKTRQEKTRPRRPCADCITRHVEIRYGNRHFSHKYRPGMKQNAAYSVILNLLSKMLKRGLANETG